MMTIEHLSFGYSKRKNRVLNDCSLRIDEGKIYGLLGKNGVGKSTLLYLMTGLLTPTEGHACLNGTDVRLRRPDTLSDFFLIPEEFDLPDYNLQKYVRLNAPFYPHFDHENLLRNLEMFELPEDIKLGELSMGQKKKALICFALATRTSWLIMDEPTNHLDDKTIMWLEEYLRDSKAAILLSTHDRYFLDCVADSMIELDRGHVYTYTGNYGQYLEQRQARLEREEASEAKRRNLIRREKAWIQRGAQARSTKQKARKERYEQLCAIEAGKPIGEVEMFDTSVRLGKTIIDIDDMAFGYDPAHPLFQHVTYHVVKHDRIGIIGENGVGKSTLLKVLAGQLAPTEGTVTIGQTVRFGFFTQQLPQFDEGMRVIDYVQEHGHFVTNQFGQRISATRLLDQFLFTEEMQYTYIAKLSGGERRRLYLLRLLMDQPNVLLLDEPTNDLDIPTLTVLERYLDTFQGVVLVVSHDRYFLDRVVDKLFTLEKGTWDRFYGDYSEYLEEKYSHHQEKKSEKPVSPSITKTNITPTKAKAGLTSRQEEELRRITEELPRYEAMLKGLNAAIAAAGSNYEEVESLLAEQKETQDKVDTLTERWCELEDLKS